MIDDTKETVLTTLQARGWDYDGDIVATHPATGAVFWYDGGTPRLEFDHFIPAHLELANDEWDNADAILREIDIEVQRWMNRDNCVPNDPDPEHTFEAAREFDRTHPEYWEYRDDN